MAKKKLETNIVKLTSKVVLSAEMTSFEYSVMKLALRHYGNEGSLSLLKRIEKQENGK